MAISKAIIMPVAKTPWGNYFLPVAGSPFFLVNGQWSIVNSE